MWAQNIRYVMYVMLSCMAVRGCTPLGHHISLPLLTICQAFQSGCINVANQPLALSQFWLLCTLYRCVRHRSRVTALG